MKKLFLLLMLMGSFAFSSDRFQAETEHTNDLINRLSWKLDTIINELSMLNDMQRSMKNTLKVINEVVSEYKTVEDFSTTNP